MKKSRESLSEEQIQEAFRRYCSGENICDIADGYFVCTRTLERMFKRRKLYKSKSSKKRRAPLL